MELLLAIILFLIFCNRLKKVLKEQEEKRPKEAEKKPITAAADESTNSWRFYETPTVLRKQTPPSGFGGFDLVA